MNEVYTGRRERTRETRRNRYAKEEPQDTRATRLGRLILKQTAAAIVCAAVVWGMHSAQAPRISHGAQALGRALRYESDLSAVKQTGKDFSLWFRSKFAPEDQNPLEDTQAPATPDTPAENAEAAPPVTDPGGEVTEH